MAIKWLRTKKPRFRHDAAGVVKNDEQSGDTTPDFDAAEFVAIGILANAAHASTSQ
jgi:hypothetical protein